ncbi:MAG: 6-phosphofructokinase, partial [Lachnospiraceae bacterium]|nr:6-phosphofructokinase [Lachnospiraceae bacterium]
MGKNCIVAQSGGPTAAINASLAGVISAVKASENYDKLYGAIHGIQGVLRKNFMELSVLNEDFIERLSATPAMYLGSCRFKLPDYKEDEQPYKDIFGVFEEYDISAFFYIGGNDSMDTVAKLSAYAQKIGSNVKIAGIPKTIDNDLLVTDHTPGFGSAAKYI